MAARWAPGRGAVGRSGGCGRAEPADVQGLTSQPLRLSLRAMPNYSPVLDGIFSALADPTRRAVLERLGGGPAPMTALARPFRMKLPSFAQHLAVLEGCGLVRSRKVGRVRTYRLVLRPLAAAAGWLAQQRSSWNRRLDRLDATLAELTEDKS